MSSQPASVCLGRVTGKNPRHETTRAGLACYVWVIGAVDNDEVSSGQVVASDSARRAS
jgi:hypothetical protein